MSTTTSKVLAEDVVWGGAEGRRTKESSVMELVCRYLMPTNVLNLVDGICSD